MGTAIYRQLTLIVAVTGEPEYPPLPIQPHLRILKICYDDRFARSSIPSDILQKCALFLLKLGQQHLILLLESMSDLEVMFKAATIPPVPLPGAILEAFIAEPLVSTSARLHSFHAMACTNEYLPDLSRYIDTPVYTRASPYGDALFRGNPHLV